MRARGERRMPGLPNGPAVGHGERVLGRSPFRSSVESQSDTTFRFSRDFRRSVSPRKSPERDQQQFSWVIAFPHTQKKRKP